MRKEQKKRIWTPEQKLEIVRKHLDDHISVRTLGKIYELNTETISRWTKEYFLMEQLPLSQNLVQATSSLHYTQAKNIRARSSAAAGCEAGD